MNVILILLDSLNKSNIEPYGGHVETKSLQKLADKGVVFENHFICSAPCMPARRELFSGRKNEFLWKGWGSVEPFDRLLPVEAKRLGATTALVTDHYHYWEGNTGIFGYHENYNYTDLIRGHEHDHATSEPLEADEELPNWVKAYMKWRPKHALQYYRNFKHNKEEKDWMAPKVMQSACDWLDRNHNHEKFFLHIESFDPHEPFHIPEPYRSMYGSYNEDFTCWPPYQNGKMFEKFMKEASEEEKDFVRAQYYGKVTMVDRWLGKVFEKMDELNLWDNTMVILTTDHGHALAEPEKKIKQYAKGHPIFEDVANIPLIIYHPEIKGGKKIDNTFSTIVDLRATILDALGAKTTGSVMEDGKSLLPVLYGKKDKIRDYMLYGTFGFGANLTTWDYTYIRGYNGKKPVSWYSNNFPLLMSPGSVAEMGSEFGVNLPYKAAEMFINRFTKKMESGLYIPGVKIPQWKINIPSAVIATMFSSKYKEDCFLFDRKKDPNFQNNLAGTEEGAKIEHQMVDKLIKVLKEEGAPPEQFERLMLTESKKN
ncbi:MAG: sulfatase [archaeon]|nr:sulfatase [archaeon]